MRRLRYKDNGLPDLYIISKMKFIVPENTKAAVLAYQIFHTNRCLQIFLECRDTMLPL